MSKSLPAEVNNSSDNLTISHICPVRQKKRSKPQIQNVCHSLKLTPVNCKIIRLLHWQAPATLATVGSNNIIVFKPLSQKKTSTTLNLLISLHQYQIVGIVDQPNT